MDVTDVLRDRRGEPDGLQKMLVASVAAHVVLAAVVMIAPSRWSRGASEPPRTVMTISLAGGGTGPQNGGFTPIGGRPVQEQTPPAEPPKREAVRPPAVKAPEMTVPLPGAKPPKQVAKSDVKQAPTDARGRTPTRGAQVSPGNSIAETGVRGQGFGLSTGGGPGAGSSLEITGDFCCPGYIATMVDRVRGAWNQNQGSRGMTFIKFTIQRDGRLTDYIIEKPSGSTPLDLAALRAVAMTKSLPPLPNEYPNPTLVVHLSFEYR
jgi:TonB family protein